MVALRLRLPLWDCGVVDVIPSCWVTFGTFLGRIVNLVSNVNESFLGGYRNEKVKLHDSESKGDPSIIVLGERRGRL